MSLAVEIGAAKVAKYATSESGDTLELIERPHGGISAVLVDGQRSGPAAKVLSNLAARKAISLLGEGVRDGAVARATHDYLSTHRQGRVSAEMVLVSIDLASRTLVVSRNTRCAAYLSCHGALRLLDAPCQPIGVHTHTKPVVVEVPLSGDMTVVACTDGLPSAGEPDHPLDVPALIMDRPLSGTAQSLANGLLQEALNAESGRPRDDISVLVVTVRSDPSESRIRRLSASFPVR